MGSYTKLHIKLDLKSDVPQDVMDMFKNVTSGEYSRPKGKHFEHPFFDTPRWWCLIHGVDSEVVDVCGVKSIKINTYFKNYNGEISKFLDWIKPYISNSMNNMFEYEYEPTGHTTKIDLTK